MDNEKKLKFKTIFILIFIGLMIFSFIFLKVRELSRQKNKIDIVENSSDISPDSVFIKKNPGIIKRFSSYEELSNFISKNNVNRENYYLKSGAMVEAAADGLGSADQSSSVDFSDTNIQVKGVDEADIIKTDGKYIYSLVDKDLYIIEAYPVENAQIINKISFDDYPSDIFIKNDKLVVFGQKSDVFIKENEKIIADSMIWPGPYNNQVFLKVFDISDKKNPIEKRDLKMDGVYFNSRLINDHLYFIVNNYNYYNNEKILPRIFYQNEELNFNCKDDSKCFNPDIYYFDADYNNLNFSSIISLNVSDDSEDIKSSFYLLPNGQNLYVSLYNIYISYAQYLDEYDLESEVLLELVYPKLNEKDKETINEINSISEKILSSSEKKQKIRKILDLYTNLLSLSEQENLNKQITDSITEKHPNLDDELETTIIHKLSIFNGIVEPIAQAIVSGTVLNQFSMDEYNNYFRLATTKNSSWSKYSSNKNSYSNVYVLDENMKTIGEIKNMAPDERIYSVRFLGDKAFVVTFKQIDPLFSIDLKNPYSPKILGELKISGFSNYLHPYGENLLIGFGKETELLENERVSTKGLKISLFDISQEEPKELDSYTIGDSGSESIALYDHRAFLFSENKNILVVPAILRDNVKDDVWGETTFNGFLIFEIIDNKLNLKGKVDHLDGGKLNFDNFLDYSAKRALYIDDNLYSFSNKLIKVNNLKDLSELKLIKF